MLRKRRIWPKLHLRLFDNHSNYFSVEVIEIQQIIENILFTSWKNVIFVLITYWKSVRKSNYLYWKSVFSLAFVLVFK